MDETEIALLDDVEERESRALVLLGDRHDQPQVRVHELAVALFTLADRATKLAPLCGRQLLGGLELRSRGNAAFDGLGEADLVVLGEEVMTTDVLEIQTDEILVVTVFATWFHVLCGHCFTFNGGRWNWL